MKIDRDAPIGVFDSGVGGLTVAREIMRNLPSEKIVYFGDTARVPYGSKSRDTVIRYSRQIIHFLKEQQVKAIVIACNTASAFALDAVQHEQDIPVLGVIGAGAKVAAEETVNKRVGVIGTVGTVGSGIHEAYLKKLDPKITVIGKACPLFVPLVEEGWLHDPVTVEVANRYLQELKDKDVDTLILGCTHYPLIRSTIREVMGEKVRLVNPAYETALELKNLLQKTNMLSTGQQEEEFPYRFYVSDLADEFKEFANSILPYDVEMTKKIDKGLIITDLAGLHSGANSITGDFSLAAKGFYIENGVKTHPVEQITVAGNFFTLLTDIEEVGNDLKFPMSSVGSPSIMIKELSIAGEGSKNE